MAEQINTNSAEKGEFKLTFLTAEDIIKKQHEAVVAQTHLTVQTLDGFDAGLLTPLNPDIISR
jgi:adenylate kinase